MINPPPEAINPNTLEPEHGDSWEPPEDYDSICNPESKMLVCECPTPAKGMFLYNWQTGNYTKIRCNRYACPVCGKLKVRRLYAALYKYFRQYKFLRLWTFTLSSKIGDSEEFRFKLLSQAFSLFIKEIRRSPLFSERQKKMCYVKCIDIGQNGHLHFHALFSEFIDIRQVIPIWQHIVHRLSNMEGHICSVHAKGIISTKNAARYICKYVLKAAQEIILKVRRYTKSGKMALFDKRAPNGAWYIVFDSIRLYEAQDMRIASSYFTSIEKDITFQNLSPPT
jgi:hypothetical protein